VIYDDFKINGTIFWYYFTCKREVWLISHGIESDQEDDNISIGRNLHEESYKDEYKEISVFGSKMDLVSKKDGKLVVGEIKKSSRNIKSSRMQLLFYLFQLKQVGIIAKGELKIPLEKKIINVELTTDDEVLITSTIEEIYKTIQEPIPQPEYIPFCKKCSYSEFCWTD
jgi:CRISPR-associated exonuclease Cas4